MTRLRQRVVPSALVVLPSGALVPRACGNSAMGGMNTVGSDSGDSAEDDPGFIDVVMPHHESAEIKALEPDSAAAGQRELDQLRASHVQWYPGQ